MSLQDIFYFIAIIFMVILLLLLVILAIIMYLFVRKISEIQKNFNEALSAIAHITTNPAELALNVGGNVARTAIKGVRKIISGNDKKG